MTKPHRTHIAKAKTLIHQHTLSSMDTVNGTIHLVTMDKSLASHLLALNTRNRRLQDKHVAHLAHQIDAGQWKFTGDPIRISTDWTLIDGQHRLNAIYTCDAHVFSEPMIVITGLNSDVVLAIDQNEKRSMSDMLMFIGLKGNQRHLASTVKKLLWIERNFSASSRSQSISTSDVNDWVAAHPEEASVIIDTFRMKVGVPPSALSVFAVLALRANPLLGAKFITELSRQYPADSEHPCAAVLRYPDKLNAGSDNDFRKSMYGLIDAWNRWLEGESMPRLFTRTFRVPTVMPELLTQPGPQFDRWNT